MNDILTVSKHWHNTQHYNLLVTDQPKTDKYGQNSIPYSSSIWIWNLLQ